MKVLSSIKRWLVAKDSEASENIEKGHEIQFAKQDLENMKKDMSFMAKLKREKSDMEAEKNQHENDALSLLKAGKEELAERHAGKIELLESSISRLESSIKQQEELMKTQQAQRKKLAASVSEAENSIKMMESMDAVARSTEKISVVKVPGASSALSRFKERQMRIQERLDKAQAIQEAVEDTPEASLEKETATALGRSGGRPPKAGK